MLAADCMRSFALTTAAASYSAFQGHLLFLYLTFIGACQKSKMPPKKRKSSKITPEEVPTFSQEIPAKLREPYFGPDRLTGLVEEIEAQIYCFVHPNGEAYWDNKADF